MAKVRRIDFHPDEFWGGVATDFTAEQIGIFWMVCTRIYSVGGPIPDDAARIAKWFSKGHHRSVRAALDALIEAGKLFRCGADGDANGAGYLFQSRCHTMLNEASKRMDTYRDNGSKPKKKRNEINGNGEATAFSEQKLSAPSPPPSPPVTSLHSVTPPFGTPPSNDLPGEDPPEPKPEPKPEEKPKADKTVRRGSRLPQDWVLPDEWIDEAIRLGLSDRAAAYQAGRFADHWRSQPGQKGIKLDWKATWRNWCRSAVERQAQRAPPRPQQQTTADAMARAAEAATGGRPLVNGAQFAAALFDEGDL